MGRGRSWFAVACNLHFAAVATAAVSCTPAAERVDAYMRDLEAGGFSGAVVLYRDGGIVFSEGYGLANRERGIANTGQTVFPFGSNVKDLTRAGIIEMEVDGTITRDRTLADFFPDVPPDKRVVTIQQLLTHTAGFHPYHGVRADGVPPDHGQMTEAAALDSIFGQELLFEPGSRFGYSNSGYTLLAMIIERASGMPFPAFIADRFTGPAGMTNSGFYRDPRWTADDVAVGYGRVTWGRENSPVYWPTNAWPVAGNGGMAGPLVDLMKAIVHIDSRRRQSEAFDSAWLATMPAGETGDFYGSAGGNDFGFVSVVFYWPARDIGLVLASNSDDDGVEDPDMILDLLRLGFGIRPEELMGGAEQGSRQPDMSGADEIPLPAGDWGIRPEGTWRRVGAVLDLIVAENDSTRIAMMDALFTPGLRSMASIDEHLRQLATIRAAAVPIAIERIERANQVEFLVVLKDTAGATFELTIAVEPHAPFRVEALGFRGN